MKYMISYDLRKPGRNYQPLYDKLKEFNARPVLESQWVFDRVDTNADGLRSYFQQLLDPNDGIFVNSLEIPDWSSVALEDQ